MNRSAFPLRASQKNSSASLLEASLTFFAQHEQCRSRSVIGAAVGILAHAPAEFAEGHEQPTAEIALSLQIVCESFDRTGEIPKKPFLGRRLVGMRVVTALTQIINARGHSTADQAG